MKVRQKNNSLYLSILIKYIQNIPKSKQWSRRRLALLWDSIQKERRPSRYKQNHSSLTKCKIDRITFVTGTTYYVWNHWLWFLWICSGQTGEPGSKPIHLVLILTKVVPRKVKISEALLNSKSLPINMVVISTKQVPQKVKISEALLNSKSLPINLVLILTKKVPQKVKISEALLNSKSLSINLVLILTKVSCSPESLNFRSTT